MQATRSDQRLEEKFGEVGEAVRVNANLSDHLAEIFSIIFKDPQQLSSKNCLIASNRLARAGFKKRWRISEYAPFFKVLFP